MPCLALMTTPLDDAMLPRMDASEVAERIVAMQKQESSTYQCADYMADNEELRASASRPVDEDCRVKMCEWCYQVVDFCKFRRETVGIGMSYLDRYLCTSAGRAALANRKDYQLAAMTTLYMAIKLHEPLEMETSLLADLSRGCYTDLEFAQMEQRILNALEWQVCGPTPLCFVQHFMALFPESVHRDVRIAIMDYARYQTELMLSEYSFVTYKPSSVALAAILNAMEGVDRSRLPLRSKGAFVRAIERASGMIIEDVAAIQSYLSDILIDLNLDDSSSSLDSSSAECDFSSRGQRSTSSRSDTSPVCVGRKEDRSMRLSTCT